jgi:hypothetical protein
MPNYKNIITFSIIAFIIGLTIHLMYNTTSNTWYKTKEREKYTNTFDPINTVRCPNKQNSMDNENYITKSLLNRYHPCNNKLFPEPVFSADSLKNQELLLENVTNRDSLQDPVCDDKPPSTLDFHTDFYNFRDKTYHNSSMHEDAVDKVTDLYLSGNLSQARTYPNKKIKDLFDDTVGGINLYARQCVRIPQFDTINPDGWYQNYGTPGTQITRDEWEYNKNNVSGTIIPNDLTDNKYQDLNVYKNV